MRLQCSLYDSQFRKYITEYTNRGNGTSNSAKERWRGRSRFRLSKRLPTSDNWSDSKFAISRQHFGRSSSFSRRNDNGPKPATGKYHRSRPRGVRNRGIAGDLGKHLVDARHSPGVKIVFDKNVWVGILLRRFDAARSRSRSSVLCVQPGRGDRPLTPD